MSVIWIDPLKLGGSGGGGTPSLGSAINLSSASYFGDMTAQAGLSAAFNNVTNAAGASTAAKENSITGYVGATFPTPSRIFQARVYGSNNVGFVVATNTAVTAELYAKTGAAPTSATDGSLLGSVSFTDTTNESAGRLITSSDQTTQFDHVWVKFTGAAATDDWRVAEITVYESVLI